MYNGYMLDFDKEIRKLQLYTGQTVQTTYTVDEIAEIFRL